ncbi:HK97 gp10 family phage protein [Endozoicomonas sp. Mp262]|uniref:HK97-gp10 family putative phage morphogenesis protein n=1 Tax=Endozoicomonas sp. Mp262 TaxID=2919499 RepID=UPI0021DA9C7A
MDMEFSLAGFSELENQLKELNLVAQKKVLRQAARKSAEPIKKSMTANVQSKGLVDTGNLLESIKTTVTFPKSTNYADVFANIGVFKSRKNMAASGKMDAPVYAYWLEYGTEPHALGRSAKRERGAHQDRGNMHPGTPATPFIRPAFESNAQNALSIQKQVLSAAIQRAIARGR